MRTTRNTATTLTVVAGMLLVASPAWAAPSLTTTPVSTMPAAVGALPVDPAISNPPNQSFPVSPKQTGCAYQNVTGPSGQVIKHVAPCQTGTGNGSASSPWRRIQEALTNLNPCEVAY